MSKSYYQSSIKLRSKKNKVTQAIISTLMITPLWLNAAEQASPEEEVEVMTVTAQ